MVDIDFNCSKKLKGNNNNLLIQPTASTVPQGDIELQQVSSDTVQALKFNPAAANTPIFLAAGSWDNTCRIWEINENGQSEPKAMQDLGAPVLSVDWTEVLNFFISW
uniref:Uncharacterized protein n=1 Tax=Meloidogyne incognita TaxID=6306 RepID=A0A914N7Z7_MELIC